MKLQSKVRKYKKAAISYDKKLSNNFNNIDGISISAVMAGPLSQFISKLDIKIDASGKKKAKDLKKAEAELLALESEISSLKQLAKNCKARFRKKTHPLSRHYHR